MSRYDKMRRVLAPIGFGLAIALLARESCTKQQRLHATVVLDLGDAVARVDAIDVDVIPPGSTEVFAHFHRVALPGNQIGPVTFAANVPTADVDLHIDVVAGPAHRALVRRVRIDEGATITVPLGADLVNLGANLGAASP